MEIAKNAAMMRMSHKTLKELSPVGITQNSDASPPPDKDKITDKRMMPMTSSRMAAETSAVPTSPFNLPSCFKVATVIETLVAVRITPY